MSYELEALSATVKQLSEKSEQHDKVLFRGNGLPGITVRMARVEDRVTVIEKHLEDKATKADRKQNVILGAMLTTLGVLILHFWFHIG
jgi:hypothetical protein